MRLVLHAEPAQHVLDQEGQVGEALAQRRELHLHDGQAVIEVGAEALGLHLGAQAAVGGGDDADVELLVLRRADRLGVAPLERAQDLRLHVDGQLADFVEEDGAAGGRLEGALTRRNGAGESAALVAEKLALEQLAGNRAAVDDDERAVAAIAFAVNRSPRSLPCRSLFRLR